MSPDKRLRWIILASLLLGLSWLVFTDRRQAALPALVDATPRSTQAAAVPGVNTAGAQAIQVRDLIPREQLIPVRRPGTHPVDLFSSRSWAPPTTQAATSAIPAPAAPAAKPQPAAPAPPPFSYLGKRRDEQGWQVYLGRGDLALIVREGETIEGGYRVESIRPPTLTLVRADSQLQIAIGEWE